MPVARFETYSFPVPFKAVFRHASASRDRAENLIVAAYGDDGEVGYGEGCPRAYVTGETLATAQAFIAEHADGLARATADVAGLRTWADAHRDAIDANPAAFCAMETAALDWLGKRLGQPVEALLGQPPLAGDFRYSAVLGDAPYPAFWWLARRYRRQGFTDFKIKVSGALRRDQRKMRTLAGSPRLRLDANNLFADAAEAAAYFQHLPGSVFAIEEPVQAGDLDGCRRVGDATGARIVLDESLARAEQLPALDDAERWIVNLRVSKMGGLLRSLQVVEAARACGVGVVVGCQVGETSILSRAALAIMRALGPALLAAEGAFGTHLLQRDLATPSVMFGVGGVLDTASLRRDVGGFGLRIDSRELVKP